MKRFDGELTAQIIVCLNIAEKRLQHKFIGPLVSDAEWEIIQMSKEALLVEEALGTKWLTDL